MKYAFTTLACPSWSIEQVVEAATTLGYDGVELRLLDGAVIDPGADRAKVEQAVARCRAAGVEVCALDSSCTFNHADPGAREREVSDLLSWIDLAEHLQVPLVRVFGGHARPGLAPEPPEVVNERCRCASNYRPSSSMAIAATSPSNGRKSGIPRSPSPRSPSPSTYGGSGA